MTTSIFFYGRKSQNDEDRQIYSIEKQKELASRWEERTGQKITEYFIEELSAYSRTVRRPRFIDMVQTALKELKKGNKVIIVAWKTNRLTRNPHDAQKIERLLDQGCEFDFFEEPFRNDPAGRLTFRMFLAMAMHYSEALSSDVKDGQKTAIAQGMYPGARSTQRDIIYYRSKKTGEHFREDVIEKHFIDFLNKNCIQEKYTEKLREAVKSALGIVKKDNAESKSSLNQQIALIQSRMDKLDDRFIDGEIKSDDYYRMIEKMKTEKNELLSKIPEEEMQKDDKITKCIQYALEHIEKASISYSLMNREQKKQFINLWLLEQNVIGQNVYFKPKKEVQELLNLANVLNGRDDTTRTCDHKTPSLVF